jgi:hypothetical protein
VCFRGSLKISLHLTPLQPKRSNIHSSHSVQLSSGNLKGEIQNQETNDKEPMSRAKSFNLSLLHLMTSLTLSPSSFTITILHRFQTTLSRIPLSYIYRFSISNSEMSTNFYHDDTPAEIKNAKVPLHSQAILNKVPTGTGTSSNHHFLPKWQERPNYDRRAKSFVRNTI